MTETPAASPAPAKVPKKRGPKPTTGRFDTREELVEAVWRDYDADRSAQHTAAAYRVSEGTVQKILSGPRPTSVPAPERK